MIPFQYPTLKHKRTLSPPKFKHPRSYKRYLQTEFARLCVYCRQPDSSAPNLNFGVDHYKPKDKFGSLRCIYENLFYCCGSCNSRKSNYWPLDSKQGPYVLNPCDHEMAAHIRFDAESGRMESRTLHGSHTEDFLQLNEPASVQFRLGTLHTLKLLEAAIAESERELSILRNAILDGAISQTDFMRERNMVEADLFKSRHMQRCLSGTLPLAALPTKQHAAALVA